ncbi:MAG TPA: pseudouridine synthase [Terriglobales bacterium]|nr:pseudouridine synthase [Terriglobales bacterium]
MQRLQKIVAQAGLASRREAERWILEGRVSVNGAVVRKLGSQADPGKDSIRVDGKRIRRVAASLYFALHKPPGVITSMKDSRGRPDLAKFLSSLGTQNRVFPVGRLDFNSAGLLLLTNDGLLAQRLTHPRFGVKKRYRVKLNACPNEPELMKLRKGIRLEDGMTSPAQVRVVERLKKNAWLEIEIHEGRNRQVRRMFDALGYFVEKLIRVRFGPVSLGGLAPGEIRPLFTREVEALKRAVGL